MTRRSAPPAQGGRSTVRTSSGTPASRRKPHVSCPSHGGAPWHGPAKPLEPFQLPAMGRLLSTGHPGDTADDRGVEALTKTAQACARAARYRYVRTSLVRRERRRLL